MLQVLVESQAPRARRTRWTAVSVVLHSVVIGAAVLLTARGVQDAAHTVPIEGLVYVPAPSPARTAPAPISAVTPIAVSRLSVSVPQIPVPSITIPSPNLFSRVIEEIVNASPGSIVGTRPAIATPPGGVHTASDVDRIVAPLQGNPSPPYPARLSAVGVEGDVLVRFVVDTSGRVEAQSIAILAASHALFGETVRQWIRHTRYSPAMANGKPVRQLVQQRVGFTLAR